MHVRRSSERTVQYESRHAGDTMTKQDLRISESFESHKKTQELRSYKRNNAIETEKSEVLA